MKVIVDFCITPLGVETSLTPYIVECQLILIDMGYLINYTLMVPI